MSTTALDCSSQLRACADYHARWAVYFRELVARMPQSYFSEQYTTIRSASEDCAHSTPENQTSAYLTFVRTVLEKSDFSEPRKQVLGYANEIAECPIGYFDAELDKIFIGQPFESEQSRYRLSADLHASQLQKTSQSLNHFFAPGLEQLQELKASRTALLVQFESIVKIVNSGFDIAAIAKSAAAGALAVAMPWIGIPAIIGHFSLSHRQADTNRKSVTAFEEQFQRYLTSLDEFSDTFPVQLQTAAVWVQRKFTEINVNMLSEVLKELTQAGHSIEHYVNALDYTLLLEAEQQLQPRDTP